MTRTSTRWRTSAVATVAAAALFMAGCESMSERQTTTAKGAGIGALGGAVIGSATGGKAGTGAVVGGAIGAVAGNLWSKRMEQRKQQMEQATQGTGVDVTRTADNQLKLNIPSDVTFDVNSAALKTPIRNVLEPFANSLRDDPNARVVVIGHTDSSGSDAINNPLSLERAQSVRDFLTDRSVPGSHITVQGRGAREPVASNNNESGRAQNRRVEILLREQAG
jgi:outer membrane protein OmpA-like peptidoglycan-associated protein